MKRLRVFIRGSSNRRLSLGKSKATAPVPPIPRSTGDSDWTSARRAHGRVGVQSMAIPPPPPPLFDFRTRRADPRACPRALPDRDACLAALSLFLRLVRGQRCGFGALRSGAGCDEGRASRRPGGACAGAAGQSRDVDPHTTRRASPSACTLGCLLSRHIVKIRWGNPTRLFCPTLVWGPLSRVACMPKVGLAASFDFPFLLTKIRGGARARKNRHN